MSYAAAAALQAAVYGRLTGFAGLAGVAVLDATPSGTAPPTFVLIGPEVVSDRSDKTGGGADHLLSVAVISTASGFRSAKEVAAAVSDALVGAVMTLTTGRLVYCAFVHAKARRLDEGDVRRIDMTFRARVEI